MTRVFLGFPGPWANGNCEHSDHYTTKIGGLPDWPFPVEALESNLLACGACGSKLCLIAQVYAPISTETLEVDERIIFVFGCIMLECANSPVSWKALRVQRADNERESRGISQQIKASASPVSVSKTNWWEDLDDDDGDINLGSLGSALSEAASMASHTQKQKSNQQFDTVVKGSPLSSQRRVIDISAPVVPCFYLYTHEQPSSRDAVSISSNYSLSINDRQSDTDDHEQEEKWEEEKYEYDKALTADRTYLKFKKQLDSFPEQCLRYSYGGQPFLATADAENPGKCSFCGAPRHFEMQLMPSVIYFLQEAANDSQKHALDKWNWMTLIVYTCSKSCWNMVCEDEGEWIVATEAVIVQIENSVGESTQHSYFF